MAIATINQARPVQRHGIGSCCGSFGELLQGTLRYSGPFLVTLPIALFSRATFSTIAGDSALRVQPQEKSKAGLLVTSLLASRGMRVSGRLHIESEIPVGKGLASSTADLVAAYRAVVALHGWSESNEELHALLRQIEPSDGVMHDGIVAFRHRAVDLLVRLSSTPPLTLIAVDEGGQVDTLAMSRAYIAPAPTICAHYAELLRHLHHCLQTGDIQGAGAISTRSAQLNQQRLPKAHFERMHALAAAIDAPGIVGTHSGTCLALLLDARDIQHDKKQRTAVRLIKAAGLQPITYSTYSPRFGSRQSGESRHTASLHS